MTDTPLLDDVRTAARSLSETVTKRVNSSLGLLEWSESDMDLLHRASSVCVCEGMEEEAEAINRAMNLIRLINGK
jgi:hypothetical protein